MPLPASGYVKPPPFCLRTTAPPVVCLTSACFSPIPNQEDEDMANGQDANPVVKGKFRFWLEERRFKGSGDKCLVQKSLFELGKQLYQDRAGFHGGARHLVQLLMYA